MSDKKRPLFSLEEEEEANSAPILRDEGKTKSRTLQSGRDEDIRRVVIVGIDLPLTNIILLFLKFLLVIIPVILVLGVLLGVVWEFATHGTL